MILAVPKVRYKRACVAGFVLTDTGLPTGFSLSNHAHELAEFCFVLDGCLVETVGRRTLSARRLDATFKPAEIPHSSDVGRAGARCLVIEVPVARLGPDDAATYGLHAPKFFGKGILAPLGLRVYHELSVVDDLSTLVVEGVALQLMAQASRGKRRTRSVKSPPWMVVVDDLLHDCFNKPLSHNDIAQAVGVHPDSLARIFHREHDCTIGEYIRRLRVRCVRQHLSASDRTLAEIAFLCGFCDQAHMTRIFKRLEGITPATYRGHPTGKE